MIVFATKDTTDTTTTMYLPDVVPFVSIVVKRMFC
jgi:hypothetical protein